MGLLFGALGLLLRQAWRRSCVGVYAFVFVCARMCALWRVYSSVCVCVSDYLSQLLEASLHVNSNSVCVWACVCLCSCLCVCVNVCVFI